MRVVVRGVRVIGVFGLFVKGISNRVRRRSFGQERFFLQGKLRLQLIRDRLRNLILDGENIVHIALVLLCPDMFVGLGIDQLRIQVDLVAVSAYTSFQDMRDMEAVADLLNVSCTAILHDAGAADHFEARRFWPVLVKMSSWTPSSKERVLFLVAEIFKWQHGDAGRYRMSDKFAFPNDPASGRC